MFRAAEGPFGVDDPVVTGQHSQPRGEGTWLGQRQQAAVEPEFTLLEGVAQSGDELAAEDAAEPPMGEEEGTPGGGAACVIRSETTGRNGAVDMRMKLQALSPAMEHAEEADLGPEVSWIAGDHKQGLSARVKEQVVDEPLVLQRERGQFRGRVNTAWM